MKLKKDTKFGEKLTCHFKLREKEFDKFWPENSKVSKIFTLIVSFLAKYILFGLKKYRGIISHKTKEGCRI